MLSCGKVIGYLSKVTRHAQTSNLHRSLKYIGAFDVNNARYSSKPPGTTITPEESSNNAKRKKVLPACEATPNGTCPPSCYEICNPQNSADKPTNGNGNESNHQLSRYWKHIVAALVLTGVAIYALSPFNGSTPEKTKSKKSSDNAKQDAARRKKRSKEKRRSPIVSTSIPPEVPYLLIGGGTAAFSAFRSIKSKDPKAKVLVISEEEDLPYMRPPLSKELWYNTDRTISAQLNFKQWNGTTRSLFYEPHEFYADVNNLIKSDKGGVAVATGWKVAKIDVTNKTAFLEDGYEIKYDKCLIATGTSAKNLSVFDSAEEEVKERITTFRTKEDFLELEHNLRLPDVKNIVIIGGGFLGSELACSLARNFGESKKVYQIYKEKSIMAQVLPEYLSEWAARKCRSEGVHCIPNAEVENYAFKNGQLSLILNDGHSIEADQVIVAVGGQPNTDLAEASHLEVNPDIGGFIVNAELEARSNVWVAGDAACFYDVKLGRRRVEHHDHAVVSGRLAGENMTGAGKPYLHQSMFWSDLGPEVGYEAIGIVDSSLPTVGIFAKATEKDTPLAAVSATNEGIRSVTEEISQANEDNAKSAEKQEENVPSSSATESKQTDKSDDFGKGVVFYLRDDVVVGIVLWNVFSRMSIARQVLARGTTHKDLDEVAKLFSIHED